MCVSGRGGIKGTGRNIEISSRIRPQAVTQSRRDETCSVTLLQLDQVEVSNSSRVKCGYKLRMIM